MRRQRIVETITCDKCGDDTETASHFRIHIARTGVSGGAPIERLVDVCPTCAPPIVELHELLRRLPNNIGGAPRQVEVGPRVACSACGDEVAQSHLSSHIVKKHGVHLPQPPQCPDCDRPYKPSMMLKHRASAHGYDHAAALIATLEASPKRKRTR